jgi:hypothetical protein
MMVPVRDAMSPVTTTDVSSRASAHSCRQNRQTSMPADGRSWMSVAPHLGHRLTPSSSRWLAVSTVVFAGGANGGGGAA